MLVNGKIDELKKYSKGTYKKELFVQEVKNHWDLTDLQIRMAYLISDLAVKAEGVFSIAHNTFVNMFQRRFDMKISLSSVRRFFGLLSKIGVLSVNAAKRKNNKQSANIYIIKPIQHEFLEQETHEQPDEQASEHPYEQHNITFKNTINKPLNNNFNYNCNFKKSLTSDEFRELLTNTCHKFYTQFAAARWSKKQWHTLVRKFVSDSIQKKYYLTVPEHKIKGFVYKSLENISDNSDYKRSDDKAIVDEFYALPIRNDLSNISKKPIFYNWLEAE